MISMVNSIPRLSRALFAFPFFLSREVQLLLLCELRCEKGLD